MPATGPDPAKHAQGCMYMRNPTLWPQLSAAAGGSSWQELILPSHEEQGCELPLNHRERGCAPPSRIPDKPGSSSWQDWKFMFLPHQRLSTCSVAAESRDCFLLFRSEFAVWSVGKQTSGSNACLYLALLQQTCREFCLYRERFVPKFPWGELHSKLWKPWAMGILVGGNYICQI